MNNYIEVANNQKELNIILKKGFKAEGFKAEGHVWYASRPGGIVDFPVTVTVTFKSNH